MSTSIVNANITRQQALALADNFLDNIGSSKDVLVPRESFSTLFLLAGELIETAQENLIQGINIASGELSKSIQATDPRKTGTTIIIDVEMNFYGEFLNSGVKGTRSGSGLYQFRTEFPSEKMVKAISVYIKRAKRSTRSINRESISGHEKKNVKLSDIQSAWALARTIKIFGIKPRNFMRDAIKTTEQKVDDRFGKAFVIDIINSLPNTL